MRGWDPCGRPGAGLWLLNLTPIEEPNQRPQYSRMPGPLCRIKLDELILDTYANMEEKLEEIDLCLEQP